MKNKIKKILAEENAIKNLKEGDIVVVNGIYLGEFNKEFNNELGEVILFDYIGRHMLISFYDWGGSNQTHDHVTHKCIHHNCWWFPTQASDRWKGTIEVYELPETYSLFENLNEEDDLDWVREIANQPSLMDNAWHISVNGKKEFNELQDWLYEQGFEAAGGQRMKVDNPLSLQSIFRDDVRGHKFTYSASYRTSEQEDIDDSRRIALGHGFTIMLVYRWSDIKNSL